MTIKRRITITAVVLIFSIFAIGFTLIWSSRLIRQGIKQTEVSLVMIQSVYMVRTLLDEYLDSKNERALQEWEQNYKQVRHLLNERELWSSLDPTIVKRLEDESQKAYTFSRQLMEHITSSATGEKLENAAEKSRLLSGLAFRALEQLISAANDLSMAALANASKKRRVSETLIMLTGCLMGTIVLINIFYIRKSIVRPFNLLSSGAQNISQGHFERVPELRGDKEVEIVIQAFNKMADDLKKSAASVNKAMDLLGTKVEELKKSNADLEQFAYVASHDLQEPLRTVAGALQMLEMDHRGKLGKNSDQLIDYAIDAAKKMKSLISDLLTYSRITSGTNTFSEVDTQSVLYQSIVNLKNLIDEKKAEITCDKMPTVSGDSTQLMQVFQNLIGNAVKFGSPESPKVHVSVHQKGGEWVFSVNDNGIGIEERYFDRIFVIFQQLEKKDSAHGTGIGLSIVKKIVERHCGRVWVKSQLGLGSTFCFTIPMGTGYHL